MKGLIIQSTVFAAFPIAVLCACSSENLQTSGLGPANMVAPQQPGNTNSMMPVQNMNDPAPGMDTMVPTNTDNMPSSEDNMIDDIAPSADPDPPAGGMMMETDDTMMPAPEDEEPPPVDVPLTPAQVGGDLEGFMHTAPCQSQDFGHDCTLPNCVGGSKTTERVLQLGGEPGVIYDVRVHVYGVVEPRSYQGGARRAGANFDPQTTDFWHEGGIVPANPGTYNSYELHVTPDVPGAPNDYYLNSRTGADQQLVVRLDYTATFPVPGGGTIQFRSFDLNCRQITNCPDNECGPVGPKPVTLLAVNNADPPPAGFNQPYQTGANIGLGQWVYIDVLEVAERP